jgi:hypothetical protein
MRGAILSLAVLTAATTTLAQAETRSFRAASPSRVAVPAMPRPPMTPSIMPRPIPAATPLHCPPPPKPPLSVSIPKPDYNKRTMALIQQNIAMMAAMRAAQPSRPCDPSWSARKLARKGCPPAQITPEPILEPVPPPPALGPETIAAAAPTPIALEN